MQRCGTVSAYFAFAQKLHGRHVACTIDIRYGSEDCATVFLNLLLKRLVRTAIAIEVEALRLSSFTELELTKKSKSLSCKLVSDTKCVA